MWGVWGGVFNFITKSLDNGTVYLGLSKMAKFCALIDSRLEYSPCTI